MTWESDAGRFEWDGRIGGASHVTQLWGPGSLRHLGPSFRKLNERKAQRTSPVTLSESILKETYPCETSRNNTRVSLGRGLSPA